MRPQRINEIYGQWTHHTQSRRRNSSCEVVESLNWRRNFVRAPATTTNAPSTTQTTPHGRRALSCECGRKFFVQILLQWWIGAAFHHVMRTGADYPNDSPSTARRRHFSVIMRAVTRPKWNDAAHSPSLPDRHGETETKAKYMKLNLLRFKFLPFSILFAANRRTQTAHATQVQIYQFVVIYSLIWLSLLSTCFVCEHFSKYFLELRSCSDSTIGRRQSNRNWICWLSYQMKWSHKHSLPPPMCLSWQGNSVMRDVNLWYFIKTCERAFAAKCHLQRYETKRIGRVWP